MIVVKIGGCNGSGKTTLVRALLDNKKYDFKPVLKAASRGRMAKPEAYIGMPGATFLNANIQAIVILGSYETACGGMDTVNNQVEKMALLRKYCQPGNLVIFEGVLTGVTYGEMGQLSESQGHFGRWLYAFMDTPLKTCIERVLVRREARRVAKGHEPGIVDLFDPDKSMSPKIRAVESVRERATLAGHKVHIVDHRLGQKVAARKLLDDALKLARRAEK